VPNKNLPVKVTVFDMYLEEGTIEKSEELDAITAMFEYVGESLDYVALYDKELVKGFAFSNMNENSTEIELAYIRDSDDNTVKEEETLMNVLNAKAKSKVRKLLKQTSIADSDMCVVYIDGYKDYEGVALTKLLPIRKHFKL
jgi:hypothetical protein